MENLSISFATKSPEEQKNLRHDLDFFDELEQLELQTDRQAALIRIRQKEKELAMEFTKTSTKSSSSPNIKPVVESSTSGNNSSKAVASPTTAATGWKKGFLSQSSKSVSFNSVVNNLPSNTTTSIASVSSNAKPDIATTATSTTTTTESTTNKSKIPMRPMRDKVIERFP